MRRRVVFYLFLALYCSVSAQNTKIFEKDSKYGLKNSNDKTIIKASYDYIYPLKDNDYFLVEKERKIGVVNKDGKVILPVIYDDVQNFGDTEFMVLSNNKWGVINRFNRVVLPPEYSGFEQITDYLYVTRHGAKKGLINKFGDVIMPAKYDDISRLNDNLLQIRNGFNVGVIDDLGNIIIPDQYNSLEKLPSLNLYRVSIGNKLGILDLSGKMIADPTLDEIDCSNSMYITVKKDGKYGFIINKQYVPATYDKIVFTQDDLGVIAVKKGNLNGFITIYGLVIPPIYDNISRFSPNGYAFVEKRGKLMFVDITGKERTLQEVTGRGQRR